MTGDELRAIREEAGWSVDDMAKVLDKRYNTVWRYEHGVLDIPQVVEIIAALIRDKKIRRQVEKYL
jgi:predicted transcriptional regulator